MELLELSIRNEAKWPLRMQHDDGEERTEAAAVANAAPAASYLAEGLSLVAAFVDHQTQTERARIR